MSCRLVASGEACIYFYSHFLQNKRTGATSPVADAGASVSRVVLGEDIDEGSNDTSWNGGGK